MLGKSRVQGSRLILSALLGLFLLLTAAGPGLAQGDPALGGGATAAAGSGLARERPNCDDGTAAVATLGISELDAKINVSVEDSEGGADVTLRFLSEPRVRALAPDGPSYGKIKAGDVVVAIDGNLITTERAGEVFLNPPVGVPIDLTLRRDGAEVKAIVVPAWICQDDTRELVCHWLDVDKRIRLQAPPQVVITSNPSVPEPTERVASSQTPAPPDSGIRHPWIEGFPHVWMGIGVRCRSEGSWYTKNLRFLERPTVFRIEPGSKAEESGLRRGDVITHIDGIPMDTLEGTEHYVEIQPGDRVKLAVLRDGEPRTVEVEAEPSPKWVEHFKDAGRKPGSQGPYLNDLRYSGLLGKTAIEVRGTAAVDVTVDNELGFVIIRTPDTTIRLKQTDKHIGK